MTMGDQSRRERIISALLDARRDTRRIDFANSEREYCGWLADAVIAADPCPDSARLALALQKLVMAISEINGVFGSKFKRDKVYRELSFAKETLVNYDNQLRERRQR